MSTAPRAGRQHAVPASSLVLVAVLTLVWGCNWPVLKVGVTELAPLTFRAATLGFAGLGLLLVSKLSGGSIRIPRALWPHVLMLAFFNITGWNALILFGVQQMPAGRSAILAYTMPLWGVLFSLLLLHEPLSGRKLTGLLVGMGGSARTSPMCSGPLSAHSSSSGRRCAGASVPCCCGAGCRRCRRTR
jgi:drug/metabolite transporter (DMT)-like permease